MKKLFITPFLFIFFLVSCEKVIDVEVPSIEPKLVVDATFEVFFNENPVTADTNVKLTLTADFFADTILSVTDARVFVTEIIDENDTSKNTVFNYSNIDEAGNYQPDTIFVPQDDITYELTVIYNNETYTSKASKIKSTPITKTEQTSRPFFTGEVLELKVSFLDIADEDNFYLFDFSDSSFSLVEDNLFEDGEELTISEFYDDEDLELPSNITIKLSGISRAYFNYFRILSDQGGTGGGGPFETIPATLFGNIINTSTEANFPLGYFHISETDTFDVLLNEIDN